MFRQRIHTNNSKNQGSSNFYNLFLTILDYYVNNDIEFVLQCLKDIKEFKSTNGGEFLFNSLMSLYRNTHCEVSLVELKGLVDQIYSFIEAEIFTHYSWKSDNSTNLKKILGSIRTRMIDGDNELRVFTTNYDRAVENFCAEITFISLMVSNLIIYPNSTFGILEIMMI